MATVAEGGPLGADERITKIGLLMEAAVAYQQSAEDSLKRLKAHAQGIDAIVRDEIRRTMVDEFLSLGEECKRATQALQSIKRAAGMRIALWSAGAAAVCAGLALTILWWTLPTKAAISALRAERDHYAATVAQLERLGGRVDLRRCSRGAHLCVRVDTQAPPFGEHRDYFVVQEIPMPDAGLRH
jgi:hypothetical protein